jgi:uncharacterized GH25 family protein
MNLALSPSNSNRNQTNIQGDISMKNILLWRTTALTASLMIAVPMAQAARNWIVPSTTTTSNVDSYVTIDAVASDELFNLGRAIPLENVIVTGPDGAAVFPENPVTGKQRSSFELKLAKEGTYKVAFVSDSLNAMYKVGGEMKRFRGNAETFAKEVPPNTQDLNVSRMQSRLETFVTASKSSAQALKPTGVGLELVPLTNPTEIFAGDTGNYQFLLEGKPAADLAVTIVLGGNRYRDALNEVTLKTGKDGKFNIKWPSAGMYWLNANISPPRETVGTIAQPVRRFSYSATLEVLQP